MSSTLKRFFFFQKTQAAEHTELSPCDLEILSQYLIQNLAFQNFLLIETRKDSCLKCPPPPDKNAQGKFRFSKAASCSTRASNFTLNNVFRILALLFSLINVSGVIFHFITQEQQEQDEVTKQMRSSIHCLSSRKDCKYLRLSQMLYLEQLHQLKIEH